MNDITQMTDAEWARYEHDHRLKMAADWLHNAIRWRDQARRCKTTYGRAQARRYMRQDTLAWRRHWEAL